MYYVASYSGGAASAVTVDRAIQRYGRNKVVIWMANTKFEDGDLWRFTAECLTKRWGGKIYIHTDGRTPLDIAEERKIIPNDFLAPCSLELKRQPFEDWLWRIPKSVTVLLGLDWTEPHRIARRQHYHKTPSGQWRKPTGYHAYMPGVYEDYPLLWEPTAWQPIEIVRSWGIEPPRLYRAGFPHNNCGGRCVRQGKGEWERLAIHFPERFAQMRDWELAQRAKGGARANRAMLTERRNGERIPVTLAELEQRHEPLPLFVGYQEDRSACFCSL